VPTRYVLHRCCIRGDVAEGYAGKVSSGRLTTVCIVCTCATLVIKERATDVLKISMYDCRGRSCTPWKCNFLCVIQRVPLPFPFSKLAAGSHSRKESTFRMSFVRSLQKVHKACTYPL
jgi:hypothetical protein